MSEQLNEYTFAGKIRVLAKDDDEAVKTIMEYPEIIQLTLIRKEYTEKKIPTSKLVEMGKTEKPKDLLETLYETIQREAMRYLPCGHCKNTENARAEINVESSGLIFWTCSVCGALLYPHTNG